jgi:hypothetical protein
MGREKPIQSLLATTAYFDRPAIAYKLSGMTAVGREETNCYWKEPPFYS